MRELPPMNAYQQLLYCALTLVHEEDLVAIFRAVRSHPVRNRCIDLVNQALDEGYTLWAAFDAPSALYELFTEDWPELRVSVRGNMVLLLFGTNGPPSDIVEWDVEMSGTGQVVRVECLGRDIPEERRHDPTTPWFSLS